LAKLPAARRKGVVFTNGCFDLLHRGHVTYLRSARKLGQVLIVALNDDASTRRLKGPTRPINTLADRLEVMAALEMVDYVTWFEEDTPLETILKLRPHVLVKGGDYRTSEIVGAAEVESWGGSVRSLELVRGKSTTEILKRAKK
jgi:rfaE bifunctional protein nucleotidyltransferase chain/domain